MFVISIIGAMAIGCLIGVVLVNADDWIANKRKNRYIGRYEKVKN